MELFGMNSTTMNKNWNQCGFTLMELMVAIGISILVSLAVFQTFESQQKSYIIQERTVESQQTLRSLLIFMENDIRMAGYDPNRTGNFGITTLEANQLTFTMDDDSGGTTTINYELYDSDGDGENKALRRTIGGSAIAYHVDDLQFAYAFDSDGDDALDTDGGQIIWAIPEGTAPNRDWKNLDTNNDGNIDVGDTAGGTLVTPAIPVDEDDVRAVRIWVMVRASNTDGSYSESKTYVVGANRLTNPTDGYRRKLGEAIIKLRNMGL